ncbi:MAG TPA: thioesterase domain-containing protein [Herpetosiphonaceae bacterium]
MTTTPAQTPWITFPRPNPAARLRLFCFPYAGGGASIYRTWSSVLPPEIEVYPVQPPGRETRLKDKPFTQVPELVASLSSAILPHLNMPYAFFGHSMGALTCFELARQLRRQNAPLPLHIFVSGHRAPQIPDDDEPIYHLPDAEFIEELRTLNGTPDAVLQNDELMRLMLPLLRADFELCNTYTFTEDAPLPCPITAYGGLQDDEVSRDQLAAWREHTSAHFTMRMFPGDHFYLHGSRALLLQTLAQDLVQVLRRVPPR